MHKHLLLNWRTAFAFVRSCDGWQEKILLGGLWIALFPPVGWLLALGYRTEAIYRMIDNRSPILPEWNEWWQHIVTGVKAAGVILIYFIPYTLLFWVLALGGPSVAVEHWLAIAVFFIALPLCIPVCMAGLPVLYLRIFPWVSLTGGEFVILALVFCGTTFIIPAAFAQLSLNRTFSSAFRLRPIFRLICGDFRMFVEAWLLSLVSTACAFASFLFFPWGVFYSYLVNTYAFNNLLALSADDEVRKKLAAAEVFAVSSNMEEHHV